jgi:hypothetical protein
MKELILKFDDKVVTVRSNEDGLYCLNDIYRASGFGRSKEPSKFFATSRGQGILSCAIIKQNGKVKETYLNKLSTYKYASWVSDKFYDAVFETFEAAANGDMIEAVNIATKVAIPQELIDKEASLRITMNALISEKFPDQKMVHSNFSRLISKAVSGFTPKELTDGSLPSFKYMISKGHLDAVGAYIASLENTIMGLKVGLDYHTCAAMLHVKTGKNAKVFK